MKPSRKRPEPATIFTVLLGVLFLVAVVTLTLMKLHASRRDEALTEERMRMVTEGERLASETRTGYAAERLAERSAEAATALEKARTILASCETRRPNDPGYLKDLSKAARAFDVYLEFHPDNVQVLVERARAHELRSLNDQAVIDLKRAIRLKKELEPELRPKIEALRAR